MRKIFSSVRRKIGLLLVMGLVMGNVTDGFGQLFRQDFGNASVNVTGTSGSRVVAAGDYVDGTSPGTSKWNYIATNSKAATYIYINTETSPGFSGQLVAGGADGSTGYIFSRTTNLSGTSPTAIKISFNMKYDVIGNSNNSPAKFYFQVGSGFSSTWNSGTSSSSQGKEIDANVFTGFSLANVNTTTGANLCGNDGTTIIQAAIGESFNTWTIVINNSGSTLSYTDPNSATESVADNAMDIWIGTNKVGNDIAAVTASQTLDDFKFGEFLVSNARAMLYMDWIQIDDLTPPSCISPSFSSQSTATQTKFVGESFNAMTVTASGTGILSYQWYSSDDNATNTPGDDVEVGDDSNSFTPSSASAVTKYYYCVVTGDCGTITSEISGAIITNNTVPTVALTSGSNSTTVNVNAAMTAAVYTYSYVGDDANVSAEWYTDGTYLTTTSAPLGLSISKNTEANTVTVSGTPANGVYGTLYYKIIVNETNGNSIPGTITVNVPTPTVNLSSAAGTNNQTRKAGTAIVNISYSVTNAVGASVSGLPTGLSGSYDNGTYTISGTIDNAATLGTANYTVTATAYDGYEGSDVNASGSVVVLDGTKNYLAYITNTTARSLETDNLYQHLLTLDYEVTAIVESSLSTTKSDNDLILGLYDVVVIGEPVTGSDAKIHALEGISKPVLSSKHFTYTSGRWTWGAPNNGANKIQEVTVTERNHPIFNGITFNGDNVELLDNSLDNRGIGYVSSMTFIGHLTLAYSEGSASKIAIQEIPVGTEYETGKTMSHKFIMIAINQLSYAALNSNSFKIVENALEYILSPQTVYDSFRSKASGNWSDASSWESSSNGTTWHSDVVVPTTFATATNILADHNVTVNTEIKINSVTINSNGQLNVGAGKKLEITTALINNGALTVNSDGNGTGTLLTSGSISGSGTTSIQQHLTSGRNWYFASPVSIATSNVIKGTTGNQLWQRNVATNSWLPEITATDVPLTPGRGYIAKVAETGVVTFTGALNNGQVQYAIGSHAVTSGKFHLVGNPYPSYLDWQSVVTANADVMPTMWFRTKTATDAYMFATVLMSDGTPIVSAVNAATSVSKLIPPMQAFWVRINDNVENTNFTVNNTMRSHADQLGNRFKAPANQHQLLRLELSNGINNDEAVLYFNANASDAFDRYDSPKMFNNNAAIPEIYTRAGNERLVINGLNGYNFNTMIPLGFNTGQAGSFSIRASQLQNFDSDTQVYLLDKTSNKQFNLSEGEAYSFTSDATSSEDRFAVLFKSASGTSSVEDGAAAGMYLTAQNGRLTLQMHTAMDNARVTVYSASGQSVHSQDVVSPTSVLSKTLEAGVYVVKMVNGGRTTVLRTIIN